MVERRSAREMRAGEDGKEEGGESLLSLFHLPVVLFVALPS